MQELVTERELVLEMLQEEATVLEHPPIEVDPVADFEIARAAMEQQINNLNAELAQEREARLAAEQDRDLARQERDAARNKADETEATLEQARKNATDLAKCVKKEQENTRTQCRRLHEQIRKMTNRPMVWPILGVIGSAALAFLVGAAVEANLVSYIIGEPCGYGCLVVSGIFAGIAWERLSDRIEVWRNEHGNDK